MFSVRRAWSVHLVNRLERRRDHRPCWIELSKPHRLPVVADGGGSRCRTSYRHGAPLPLARLLFHSMKTSSNGRWSTIEAFSTAYVRATSPMMSAAKSPTEARTHS